MNKDLLLKFLLIYALLSGVITTPPTCSPTTDVFFAGTGGVVASGTDLTTLCSSITTIQATCTAGSGQPLLFLHTDSVYYCRSEGSIQPWCTVTTSTKGTYKTSITDGTNTVDTYQCIASNVAINTLQSAKCTSGKNLFMNPDDTTSSPATPLYYQCVDLSTITCTNQVIYYDSTNIDYYCQTIAQVATTCTAASQYVYITIGSPLIYSCKTASQISSACTTGQVVYQNPSGYYECVAQSSLNSTYSSDCTTNQYLYYNSAGTVPSYVCTTLTSSTCTGGNVLYFDITYSVYSCQTNSYVSSQCSALGTSYVAYQQDPGINPAYPLNLFTCVTILAMNTECSIATYPYIFYYSQILTYVCRRQSPYGYGITGWCNSNVIQLTKTDGTNSFNFFECFPSGYTAASIEPNLCTPKQVFYNPLVSGGPPPYYQCKTVTSTTCTSPLLLYQDSNPVYYCQLIADIVTACAANTGNIYAYLAYDATVSTNDYTCQTASFIELACTTTSSPSDTSATYETPTGYYQCVTKSSLNTTYATDCTSVSLKLLIYATSPFPLYTCTAPASSTCNNANGYYLYQDSVGLYSCQTIAYINSQCTVGQVMYQGNAGASTIIRCETLTTLNSTITSNQDCKASGNNLFLNTITYNGQNYNYYSCSTPLTSTTCSGSTSLMFYDPNSLYSCQSNSYIKGICTGLNPAQIVYKWTSTAYSPNFDIYECILQSSLYSAKSSIDTCQNSGTYLWMDPTILTSGFYYCKSLTTTTCSSALSNSLMYYDQTNKIYQCLLYSSITNNCGTDDVYQYIQNGVTIFTCTTASNLQNVLIPACEAGNGLMTHNAQNTATQPYTPDNYQCIQLSPGPICTSPNVIYLQTASPSIYSCLTASQITTKCGTKVIYQKVVSGNSIFSCDTLSTLHTDYIADCSSGQVLWLSPASGDNPASYLCSTIPPNPCTGSNVLYYDAVNQVYDCDTVTNINTICTAASKVDLKQVLVSPALTYYSCQAESNLQNICTGTNLIFYDVTLSIYECLTKANINCVSPNTIYQKIKFGASQYMCENLPSLNTTFGSSDCTSPQKLWLDPGNTNTPQSYVCKTITSTSCASQTNTFMYYDNINNYVYSCLSAAAISALCTAASQIVYQWTTAQDTFYQCQALSTLNSTKKNDCTSPQKLFLDAIDSPNSYVCTAIDGTTCSPNSVFYDMTNGVYSCQPVATIQGACSNQVYTWTDNSAIYYSCQTSALINMNCPGQLIFYDSTANVYSCQTKSNILTTCGLNAVYQKNSPITFYQCVIYSNLNTTFASDCTSPQKLWLNPGDANTPASYVCTSITPSSCASQSNTFMYYDDINNNIYACFSASQISTACASQYVYQWTTTQGTFYQCQALSSLNATVTSNGDCTNGEKIWFNNLNQPFSYACTSLSTATCSAPTLLYYDTVNGVYSCNSEGDIAGFCGSSSSNPVVLFLLDNSIPCYECQTNSQCTQPGYYKFQNSLLVPPILACTVLTTTTCGGGVFLYEDSATGIYTCQSIASMQSKCSSPNALFNGFLGGTISYYVCAPKASLNGTYAGQCPPNQILLLNTNNNGLPAYQCSNINPNPCPQFIFFDVSDNLYSCITSAQLPTLCGQNYLSQNINGIYQCVCTFTQITLVTSQKICVKQGIPGCQTYALLNPNDQSTFYCTACTVGTTCISNCVSYSPDFSVCLKCSSGYNPILNSQNKYICLSTAYTIPVDCTQIDQSNAIKCITCQLNYIVNYQTNNCVPMITNCTFYSGNTCIKCQDGHILLNGVCVNPPSNCYIYDNTTALCITCQGGYVVNQQGTCSVDLSCPSTQYRNFTTNTCVNGQVSNCATYTKTGTGLCATCQTNYQIDSIGFSCTYVPPPIVCQPNTTQYVYVIIGSQCVQVDANCAPHAYNSDGTCQYCNNGYNQVGGLCYLDTTSNLRSNNDQTTQSIICDSSHYLVGVNCVPIPDNCNNFNRITNLCQGCSNNLILYNNLCVPSITCPQGSYSIGISCTPIDSNCVIFDYLNLVCTLCITNYTPQGSLCINNAISNPCPNSRTWYNSATGLCIGISQTCDTFNSNTGDCITCVSPYVIISQGVCGVDQSNAANACPSGQVQIANNVCVPAVANCKTYQQVLGYCLTCQKGYFLNFITSTNRTCN